MDIFRIKVSMPIAFPSPGKNNVSKIGDLVAESPQSRFRKIKEPFTLLSNNNDNKITNILLLLLLLVVVCLI